MSKPSHRPTRQARKEHKQKRREAQRQLHAAQAQRGVVVPRAASVSNRLCPYSTEAEEQAAREGAVAGQLGVFRALLPKRLKELSKIPDPRQPKKVKHKLTVVLLYGGSVKNPLRASLRLPTPPPRGGEHLCCRGPRGGRPTGS